MFCTISDPLIMTENMRFRPYSYPCFLEHKFVMGGRPKYMCSYAHNESIKMTLYDWTVNILTFPPPNLLHVYQNISGISI